MPTANPSQPASAKRKSIVQKSHLGGLAEKALLQFLKKAPTATQKMIAGEIGKSERTVKSMTKPLQERSLLARRHGRKAGTWEAQEDEE